MGRHDADRDGLAEGAGRRGADGRDAQLKRDNALEPGIAAARVKAVAEARDPERRRKIADAARGRPRPPHVVEAMTRGRIEAAKRRKGEWYPPR